jgi:preprotein translocase subunit SecD
LKNISWKLILVIIVVITAVVYILPSIKQTWWPHKKINLGLDLQGGMHLVLEVDTEKALESTIERIRLELRNLLKKERIRFLDIERVNGTKISVRLQGKDNIDGFERILDKEFKNLRVVSKSTDDSELSIVMDLPEEETRHIKKLATRQALETIRNRIDQFGVSEPDIRLQGEKRILIQLPGIKDTQRAKDLIGKTALLEFKLLDETHDVNAARKGDIPLGSEILAQITKDSKTNREIKSYFLIKKQTLLTGANLTDARVQIDSQFNEPYVSLTFDRKGGRIFAKITEENVKKRLAIVLDNHVYSAPVIQEKISGGEARITGNFTMEEAKDLGSDSINKGLVSVCVGGILVIIFMVIYYKGSGFIADLALILNIVLIAGGLAAFQATLTLPGIAGIILTIGIAVDANVLIFERIREELQF